ncbi:MAG: site-specific integrase, partial [Candidatus Margulisiibacteriota bacterium]
MFNWDGEAKDFLDYLHKERNYSPNTVLAYQRDLLALRAFLEKQGLPIEVTVTEARLFLHHMQSENYSRRSIARKVSACTAFWKFRQRFYKVDANPWEYIST